MATDLRQTAFRLTDVDLAVLDDAQRLLGMPTRTETLRYIIREWARDHGIDGSMPKRRRAKRNP